MHILALFDIDNTLIQSSAGHKQAYREAVKDVYGIAADMNAINHHGMTDQEIIFKVLRKYKLDEEKIASKLKKCMEIMALKYAEIVKSENINTLDGVGDLRPNCSKMVSSAAWSPAIWKKLPGQN